MKDHERKLRNLQNQKINLLIANISKKIESESNNIPLQKGPSDSQDEIMKKDLEKMTEELKTKSKKEEVTFFVKYYYIIREFVLCFTYSFFPTWYIELYIEEQSDSYKAIVEKITKKNMKPEKNFEESQKIIDSLKNQLSQKKEQLNNLKMKLDDLTSQNKNEEIKDEESIDPTDNINPDNYKLIQKLQHLHKVEIMKEKFKNEEEESNENSSINTDTCHNIDYRRESEIKEKKRCKSLENIGLETQ